MVQQARAFAARSDNLFDPEFDLLMEGENQFLPSSPDLHTYAMTHMHPRRQT